MKKILFTLILFTAFGGLAIAQCDGHAKISKAEKKSCHSDKASAQALKAADMNDLIEKRTCEKSGKVSFVRKTVDEQSDEVSYVKVVYDEENNEFKEASTQKMDAKAKAGCCASKAKSKGCCAKKTKASTSEKQEQKDAPDTEPSKI